jgi:tRNA pseudouridine55 synthase
MDGLLLVDKPAGPTSHDVVARVRRRLAGDKTGHFGTLDPLATGLLIVAAGKAVRFNPYYAAREKSYQGRIHLGFATDTYDAEGRPITLPATTLPGNDDIAAAARALVGTIEQIPPPFSAKKLAGRPLYSYARQGRVVEASPVPVVIHEFAVQRGEGPSLDFFVRCSSGTYIRSLAHDLGRALGCGAFLASLRRTAIGEFDIRQARSLDDIERLLDAGASSEILIPLDKLLIDMPAVEIDAEGRGHVRDGRTIPSGRFADASAAHLDSPMTRNSVRRVVDPDGHLIALAKIDELSGSLTPFLVLITR